jgi:hypothetical protein
MVTLKMSDEDGKLLVNVLNKFTNDYRPLRYGGKLDYNPPITEEEWLKLNNLVQKLPYEIKL